MYLTDIHVDRFGTLNDLSLNHLSDRITVYWGPNGGGKTTLVQFLRGVLFGLNRSGLTHSNRSQTEGGAMCIRTPSSGTRRLQRTRLSNGEESFRVLDGTQGLTGVAQHNHIPGWISEDVFREVFTVGYEEADRFELLTRLSLENSVGSSPVDAEIRAAELAMQEAVRERDGDSKQSSIADRTAELRRRQLLLQHELQSLRIPAGDLPERIRLLALEIDSLKQRVAGIDVRLCELDAEIERLESLAAELRRRNILPLDRPALEYLIRALSQRLERWQAIRHQIAQVGESLPGDRQSSLHPKESLISIRTLVSRLEDRVQGLAARSAAAAMTESSRNETDVQRDVAAILQLREEMAALCRYVSRHETAVEKHEDSLEHLLADRSLADATQMEILLQERISSLKDELHSGENILDEASFSSMDGRCRHPLHNQERLGRGVGLTGSGSLHEVEAELARLRSERTRLVAERGGVEETLHTRRALLERLRTELQNAATLEQIDGLRAQMAELDAQLVLLDDRRRTLDHTEASLRDVITLLRKRRQSGVLELASGYVRRLTDGDCLQVLSSPEPPHQLLVQTRQQTEPLTVSQLSRGTRHQLALAVRLALIRTRAEAGEHMPIILDDVFITSDDARAAAVVQLLTEVAAQGQQIVFLTCQKDVRDLFARYGADVRTFGSPAEERIPPRIVPEPPRVFLPPPAAPVTVPAAASVMPAPQPIPVPQPVQIASPVPAFSSNWLFYLEVDHGIDDLAGITLGELDAFRAAGLHTVDDLLQRSAVQIEQDLRKHGYVVPVERLQALRGQAELTCRVPMLRRSDAALLYAAGIETVELLRQLRPETVYDRIVAFQRTEPGSRYRRAGRLIDRQQAINWARFGQHSRSLSDARTSRSRFSVHRTSRVRPPMDLRNGVSRQQRREKIRQTVTTSRRRPRVSMTHDAAERRALRLARRRRLAARLRTSSHGNRSDEQRNAETTVMERPVSMATVAGRNLRFFLSRTSDVEAAPSIGPKTAESLYALGVRTVDDLLQTSADRLAGLLNHRRITTSVISQWQAQSRLMCQVPELRGHDVQILVACGITEPEDLANRKPHELMEIVAPFVMTREGERIIRNGRKPDISEVSDWIQWAVSSRSFRAA